MRSAMRCLLRVVLALVVAGCSSPVEAVDPAPYDGPTVSISGYTFSFTSNGAPVGGATVTLVERPGFSAVSDEQGRYQIEVPDGAAATLFVEHPSYVRMYLQTFTTAGQALDHVNFQMVTPIIYDLFSAVLEVEPDPGRCQIATTVSTKDIAKLTLEEHQAYGAHGVPGATVSAEPAVPDTVYFNEKVVPDRALTETSGDGGVVWPNVPPGVYVFSAAHPSRSFADFKATCEPGRFINAGPPQGLHERY